MKDWIKIFLREDEIDDFGKWAFGEEYKDIQGTDRYVDHWNERHKYLYEIKYQNQILSDLFIMTAHWVREKKYKN